MTSLDTSTLIVESLRSLVVSNAARVLNHNQLSLAPVPTVLLPFSFSYSPLFFSYSSRVIFECHLLEFVELALVTTAAVFVLLAAIFVTPFARLGLEFDVLLAELHAAVAKAAPRMAVNNLNFIFSSSLLF